jgi:UDP-N-acetyl-D-glucosamine dehydrogenase
MEVSFRKKGKVAIIGQGYVGLPLAMASVKAGWEVIGIDNVSRKVEQIKSGISPIEDISNSELQLALSSEKYEITDDYSKVSEVTTVILCVPTPLNSKHEPDLSLLEDAVRNAAPFLGSESILINESTSYPGTLRNFIINLVKDVRQNGIDTLYFASAPERVNPGDLVWNQTNTPRLVGGVDEKSKNIALNFYDSICNYAIPVASPEIAEAAKLLENTFRLVNIGLINEFAQACANAEINIYDVIEAAASKPYGFMRFTPGVGVGGHCIPVDPLYFTWWARNNGNVAELVESADSVNRSMPKYIADWVVGKLPFEQTNYRILLLGVAYKPGVADTRETAASALRSELEKKGVVVGWHDPLVDEWEGTQGSRIDWPCDAAILVTNQPGLEIQRIIKTGTVIFDCTNSIAKQDGVISL